MQSGPEIIFRALDAHLTGVGEVRLFGGAALVLAPGRARECRRQGVTVSFKHPEQG